MAWNERLWDWLPRIAALVACALMAWSVIPGIAERGDHRGQKTAAAANTITTDISLIAAEPIAVQADASTQEVAVFTRLRWRGTDARYTHIVYQIDLYDRADAIVWSVVATTGWQARPGAPAVPIWQSFPRTLPVESYHRAAIAITEVR